ncbi:MAG TPA: alpha/beta fold hydrolase [Gammaproteobacteria bacterium]|nr:alpha/beta fold hydrolase [Gammaproteobacteria bacterium]
MTNAIDRKLNAGFAQLTGGISPQVILAAYSDWLLHLSTSPGKQVQLAEKAWRKWATLAHYAGECARCPDSPACIEPLPQDRRFSAPEWKKWPYNFLYQSFLLTQQWWHNAATEVPGVSRRSEDIVEFTTRQVLDVFSPSNFAWTNPEVIEATLRERGQNLVRGMNHLAEDISSGGGRDRDLQYEVGKDVAVTPGKVVHRNRLMELIQYAPVTDKVHPEPLLIVPAWIMKYYILDLSPHNSLVRFLVEKGFTVFMISWKNPGSEDRELSLEDYRSLGVMDALDAISAIVPGEKIHAAGYCLGGTLLGIAAAAMARDGDERLKSLTLLTTQLDFTEAGELMLFVNEGQINFLESLMWNQGYLDSKHMGGAFQLLRSNDLIWSRMVRTYLLGEKDEPSDLMSWNADQTRMPYRMHSEYLRKLFLNNELARGRYEVGGSPVSMSDVRAPIFAVGTVTDHVVPWRSAFKIHLLSDAPEVTFVLTSGGHNAGIVSPPDHPRRSYQISTSTEGDRYVSPEAWLESTPGRKGSWWPEWQRWLEKLSSKSVDPPIMGAPSTGFTPLDDAPGRYVHAQ